MPAKLVPRALHPVRVETVDRVEAVGVYRTLTGSREATVELEVLSVDAGLVLVEDGEARIATRGDVVVLGERGVRLCRFHEGPRGDPLRQRWCNSPAVAGSWCQRHKTSILALYEKCTAGRDWDACRAVDAVWRDERYIVYLLWHGAGFKVGVTRAWRLFTRLLEQPHVAAAVLAETGSILEARRLEARIGRQRGVNEGTGVPRARRMRASLSSIEPHAAAERLAAMLAGLGYTGRYKAYALRVECPHAPLLAPSRTPPTGSLRFTCAWGGIIVFQDASGGYTGVPREQLIHYEFRVPR